MDQLICASLSHIHYWYEVAMLKVSAIISIWLNMAITIHQEENTKDTHTRITPVKYIFRGFDERREGCGGNPHRRPLTRGTSCRGSSSWRDTRPQECRFASRTAPRRGKFGLRAPFGGDGNGHRGGGGEGDKGAEICSISMLLLLIAY